MKKSLLILGMLAVGFANAQQEFDEKVGINTDTPSATLNVKTKTDSKSPKNLELENQAGNKLVTVLNNGKIGFNTDTPNGRLTLYPSGSSYSDNSIYHHLIRDGFGGGEFGFRRSRGTKETLESVQQGDEIAHLNFSAYANGKYSNAAFITASVAEIDARQGALGRISITLNKKVGHRQVLNIANTGYIGLGRAVSTPLAPLHIQTDVEDITREENERGQKDEILISTHYGGQNATTKERLKSISSIGANKAARYHSIDFGLLDPASATIPFMAFRVATPSSPLMGVEHMRITNDGNIGMGTTAPTNKLHIKADADKDPLKLEGLREATGTGNKSLVVDANGVVKVGEAVSSSASAGSVKIGSGTGVQCTGTTIGTINFGEVTTSSGKRQAFGFCTKDANGTPMWAYMVAGSNPFSSTNPTFGEGLQ